MLDVIWQHLQHCTYHCGVTSTWGSKLSQHIVPICYSLSVQLHFLLACITPMRFGNGFVYTSLVSSVQCNDHELLQQLTFANLVPSFNSLCLSVTLYRVSYMCTVACLARPVTRRVPCHVITSSYYHVHLCQTFPSAATAAVRSMTVVRPNMF